MKKKIFEKTMVIGLIALFIGISIVPGLSAEDGSLQRIFRPTRIFDDECHIIRPPLADIEVLDSENVGIGGLLDSFSCEIDDSPWPGAVSQSMGELQEEFLIVVNSNIKPSIQESLDRYIADLEWEGDYTITVYAPPTSITKEALRNYLINRWFSYNMVGCIFIGDLPVANFEEELGMYIPGPCDDYWTNLDVEYLDTDGNGYIDSMLGGTYDAEIWFGRLTASPLGGWAVETNNLNNYFNKNHKYRAGIYTLPKRSLCYDVLGWGSGVAGYNTLLDFYSDATYVDPEHASYNNYCQCLVEGYEWLHLEAHGAHTCHQTGSELFYSNLINGIDPHVFFYSLNSCSTCCYTANNYIGGSYIFSPTYGLVAIGCTVPGYFQVNSNFLDLSSEANIGKAFQEHGYSIWWGGVTILGDPTLKTKLAHLSTPTGLSIEPGYRMADLSWNPIPEKHLTGYRIYRSTSPSSGFVNVGDVDRTITSYHDGGLTNTDTYYYKIMAFNNYEEGNPTEAVSATTLPLCAPTGLFVEAGDGSITLSWDLIPWEYFEGYKIYRSTTPESGFVKVADVDKTVTSYQDTRLEDTIYYYRITAFALNDYEESEPSDTVSETPLIIPPAAPRYLFMYSGDGKNYVAWVRNTELDIAGYKVYRSLSQSSGYVYIATVTKSSGETWYEDEDETLENGVPYYYKINAYDTTGAVSGFSPVILGVPHIVEPGDVNGDGVFNMMDISYMVDCFKHIGPLPVSPEGGDMNGDGRVCDFADIAYLLDYIFRGGPPPVL